MLLRLFRNLIKNVKQITFITITLHYLSKHVLMKRFNYYKPKKIFRKIHT